MKSKTCLFIILILGMVLVACTSTDESTPDLSQSITSENYNGVLTVNYPDGWFAKVTEGAVIQILIATEEALLDATQVESPQILIGVAFLNRESVSIFLEDGEEATAVQAVEIFGEFATLFEINNTIPAEEMTINDEVIAIIRFEGDGQSMTAIGKEAGDNFILLYGFTTRNEADANQDLFKSILGSASQTVAGD